MDTATDIPTDLPPVSSLHFGCEDAQSVSYDWSDPENFDRWSSYETHYYDCSEIIDKHRETCEECDGAGEFEINDGTMCRACEGSGEVECDYYGHPLIQGGEIECPKCGHIEEHYDTGPMMNYYYPLPDHTRWTAADARKLESLPLCLVSFDDGSWALALTGGGMDLSWEIAEAHMRLGLLPPLFVCRLPRMAGKDYSSPVNRWIIAGCRRTCRAISSRASLQDDRLASLLRKDS